MSFHKSSNYATIFTGTLNMVKHTKSSRILQDIREQIQNQRLGPGDRIPTERELSEVYSVSRPTVTKALQQLQYEGLVERRAGSGTFVSRLDDIPEKRITRHLGLLIPRLGVTEIFEPICARIAQLSRGNFFSLLWSDSTAHDIKTAPEELENSCLHYIEQGVDGLFFVPLELVPSWKDTNKRITEIISEAKIPTVLLDSDYLSFPHRSAYDLVGIDNIRAGFFASEHYLDQGVNRVDYLYRPYSASTIEHRLQGCRIALSQRGISMSPEWIHEGEPEQLDFVRKVIDQGARNIVCANDATAFALMESLQALGIPVPEEVRLIGFDNVRFSHIAHVPLTTFRQPVAAIGELAVRTMLNRLEHRDHPKSSVFIEPEFIVRQSSIVHP